MAKYLLYVRMQLKAALKTIPKILIGSLIFAILIGLGAYAIINISSNNEPLKKTDVALVYPENNDQHTSQLFNYIDNIDSVSYICTFHETTREEAIQGIADGKYDIGIILPDEFINRLLWGRDANIEVYLNESASKTTTIYFKQFIQAATMDFASLEASVYASYNVLNRYKSTQAAATRDSMSMKFGFLVLDRAIWFSKNAITPMGRLSSLDFAICSGIIALMLLSGILCSEYLKRDNSAHIMMLKRTNIGSAKIFFAKLFGISCIFYLLNLIIIIVLNNLPFELCTDSLVFDYINLFLLVLSIFAFVILIFWFSQSTMLGVIILFVSAIVMLYSSGAITPLALLPSGIRMLARILPSTYWLETIRSIYSGTSGITDSLIMLATTAIFCALSVVAIHFRTRKE